MTDIPDYLIPLVIFVAEMCVVTLGTLRIIFIARGQRVLAPLLGFFEILTWLFAIGQTMQNLDNVACFLAFALGFTTGNLLGLLIEKMLAMGTVVVRIITNSEATALIDQLRADNFGVTCIDGHGAKGKVQIVMTVVKRKQLHVVMKAIETHQPHAFFVVDDLQSTSQGIFPSRQRPSALPTVLKRAA